MWVLRYHPCSFSNISAISKAWFTFTGKKTRVENVPKWPWYVVRVLDLFLRVRLVSTNSYVKSYQACEGVLRKNYHVLTPKAMASRRAGPIMGCGGRLWHAEARQVAFVLTLHLHHICLIYDDAHASDQGCHISNWSEGSAWTLLLMWRDTSLGPRKNLLC